MPVEQLNVEENNDAQKATYKALQRRYLTVYLTVMGADWLQGPYLYKLYQFYGYDLVQIALLFLTGFVSSAIAGTAIGSMADSWGRRRVCIVFCIIYGSALILRLFNIYSFLFVSHLMSGTATALLFSVFETWYVAEHTRMNLPSEYMSSTFAAGTFLNGLVAIFAGIVANTLVDLWGYSAPYLASAALLALAATLILSTWPENYGENVGKHEIHLSQTLLEGLRSMWANHNILVLGAAQTLFEWSMYIFILMYTPAIENAAEVFVGPENDAKLPLGYLFSTMMLAVMIGSVIFKSLDSRTGLFTKDRVLALALGLASISFWAMVYSKSTSLPMLVIAYHVYELTTGLYYPSISALKAEAIPEQTRAAIMTLLRIPMNIGVGFTMWHVDDMSTPMLFAICGIMTTIGSILMIAVYDRRRQ